MAGAFFKFSEVFAIAKNSKNNKGKKKKRKGVKGNEEDGKSALDGISAAEGVMIRSVHLVSQCG